MYVAVGSNAAQVAVQDPRTWQPDAAVTCYIRIRLQELGADKERVILALVLGQLGCVLAILAMPICL